MQVARNGGKGLCHAWPSSLRVLRIEAGGGQVKGLPLEDALEGMSSLTFEVMRQPVPEVLLVLQRRQEEPLVQLAKPWP